MEKGFYLKTEAYRDMQYLMDTAYFHPSRERVFPTAEIKRSARCVMELRRQAEASILFNFVFTKRINFISGLEIRKEI